MDNSDKPCSSKDCIANDNANDALIDPIGEDEIQKDAEVLNVRLEDCAKKFNLSALNVKNIIFHIIKDPKTLASLLNGDSNAIESLKLTRSRLRELEQISQTKLNIELKPVAKSRPTFLEFNYDENEEDEDYQPPLDETQEMDKYEFDDFTEEELAAENSFDTGNWFGCDFSDQVRSMDPEYEQFLRECKNPNLNDSLLEENDEDEDYNIVQEGEEMLDRDEFRNDRSTKVSKRELRQLYVDIIPDDILLEEPPFKKIKAKRRLSFGSRSVTPSSNLQQMEPSTSSNFLNCVEIMDENSLLDSGNNTHQINRVDDVTKEVKIPKSWSLLRAKSEMAQFNEDEIQCLRIQMEKHVQLLTQHIVLTSDTPELISTRNQAVRMMHELDKYMYSNVESSIFRIRTLPEAVITCHEVESFEDTDYSELVGEDAKSKFPETDLSYKTAMVLSRSLAVSYPELLPTMRPHLHQNLLPNFLSSEQILLALALFELHHVPHSTGGVGRMNTSKYQTISTYFLPNKTPNQIRNHLKNVRSGSLTSPIHQIIIFAEQGKFNATFELDNGSTLRQDRPIEWAQSNSFPRWLQTIQNFRLMNQSFQLPQLPQTPVIQPQQVLYSISPTTPLTSVIQNQQVFYSVPQLPESTPNQKTIYSTPQTPANYSVVQLYDGQIQLISPNVVNSPFQSYIVAPTTPSNLRVNEEKEIVVLDGSQEIVIEKEVESNPKNESIENDIIEEVPPNQEVSDSITTTPKPEEPNEKISRRAEQMNRCMRGFDDPEVVEIWSNMVLQTVYKLVKQRLFMHEGKFKVFLSVLSNCKKSSADKYDELSKLLRDTQPELADCIAALMEDSELRVDQEQNAERCAYKSALEMMMNIHIYFNGQQSSHTKRRLLKLIRDHCFTEQNLREEMKKLLSGRHEPLWIRLKQYFRGERYTEKIDLSRAEDVPLQVFQAFTKDSNRQRSTDLNFCSEFVDLTSNSNVAKQNVDFRPNLRINNGFFMLRCSNGQSIPVNVCSPSKVSQMEEDESNKSKTLIFHNFYFLEQNSHITGSIFAPEHDRQILNGYNNSKKNLTKAVEKFVRDQREKFPSGDCPFNEENTQRRLEFLLDLLSCMNNATNNVPTK